MKILHALFYQIKPMVIQEKKRYLFVLLLFLAGILLGSLRSAWMDAVSTEEIKTYFDRFFSAYALQGTAKSEAFRLSLINYASLFLCLWLSGWSLWLLPVGIFQVILKGYRTGYTITYLLKCYHLKGLLVTTLGIIPQSLILLPALCFYLVCQTRFAINVTHLKKTVLSSAVKKQIYGNHIIKTLMFLFLLLFCSFIEGYIVPTLLQPFCGIFL